MTKMESPKKSSLKRSILKKPSPLRAVHPEIIAENEEEAVNDSQSEKPLAAKEMPSDVAGAQDPSESKPDKVTLRPKLERNLKDSFRVSSDRLSSSPRSKFLKRRKRPDSASPHMSKIRENETSFPFPDPAQRSSTDTSNPKSPKQHTVLKVKADVHDEQPHKRRDDRRHGSLEATKGRKSSDSAETSAGENIGDLVVSSSKNPDPAKAKVPSDSAEVTMRGNIPDFVKPYDSPDPARGSIPSDSVEVSMGENVDNSVMGASPEIAYSEMVECSQKELDGSRDGLAPAFSEGRSRVNSDTVCDMEETNTDDSHLGSAIGHPTEITCDTPPFPLLDTAQNSAKTPLDIPIILVDDSDDMPNFEDKTTDIGDRPGHDTRISIDEVEVIADEESVTKDEGIICSWEEGHSKHEDKEEQHPLNQIHNKNSQIQADEHVPDEDEDEDHRVESFHGDTGLARDGNIIARHSTDGSDDDLSEDDTIPIRIAQVPSYTPFNNNQIISNEDSLMDFDDEESLV